MDDIHQPHGQEAFWHLLYRFLWPFPYFRDVTRGSLLERQQNYRHNRRMGTHLPRFMLKWACLTLFFFALGCLCEELLEIVQGAPDLKAAASRLIQRANENGGPDNITVILARWVS